MAISRWFAVVTAIVTACMLAYVAHDDLGFTRQEIRTPSLIAAAIIGLVVATEYFGKRLRKPK
jgi:putative flippase GtrA